MGLNQQPMCAWSHESGEVTLTVCMNIHRAVHHNNSTRHRTAFTVPHDTAQPSVNLPRLNRRKTWIKMCLSCLKLWLLDDKASSNVHLQQHAEKRQSVLHPQREELTFRWEHTTAGVYRDFRANAHIQTKVLKEQHSYFLKDIQLWMGRK